ncbi:hypothetical protein AQBE111736_01650 [Aquirufa beregesia]|nr:hypothetical protein [Aquirufa beregesia]
MKTFEYFVFTPKVFLILSTLVIGIISCNSGNPTLTIVKEFAKQHSEIGSINSSSEMPDWEKGKRVQIRTDKGEYLVYLHNKEVVSVYKYLDDGQRLRIYHKEISSTTATIDKSKDKDIPDYKILFQVDLNSGEGRFGEILISSYSKKIPKVERERTLRKIIKKEGFVSAVLYSTEDAYKANSSESFSKAHPNAFKNGYLGQITEKGVFVE